MEKESVARKGLAAHPADPGWNLCSRCGMVWRQGLEPKL